MEDVEVVDKAVEQRVESELGCALIQLSGVGPIQAGVNVGWPQRWHDRLDSMEEAKYRSPATRSRTPPASSRQVASFGTPLLVHDDVEPSERGSGYRASLRRLVPTSRSFRT